MARAAVEVEVVIDIDREVDAVFAFVAAPENATRFSSVVVEARRTSTGPIAAGSSATLRCQTLGRAFELQGRVRRYVPNRRFVLETTAGPYHLEVDVTFAPRAGGTRLTSVVRGRSRGVLRFADSLLRTVATAQARQAVEALKEVVEREPPRTARRKLAA